MSRVFQFVTPLVYARISKDSDNYNHSHVTLHKINNIHFRCGFKSHELKCYSIPGYYHPVCLCGSPAVQTMSNNTISNIHVFSTCSTVACMLLEL